MRFGLPKLPSSYSPLTFKWCYAIMGDGRVIRAVYLERLASGTALCHRYPATRQLEQVARRTADS